MFNTDIPLDAILQKWAWHPVQKALSLECQPYAIERLAPHQVPEYYDVISEGDQFSSSFLLQDALFLTWRLGNVFLLDRKSHKRILGHYLGTSMMPHQGDLVGTVL